MGVTRVARRQKLRRREAKRERAEDRKQGVIERLYGAMGVGELLRGAHASQLPLPTFPLETPTRAVPAAGMEDDPEVVSTCRIFSRLITDLVEVELDGRCFLISLDDYLRGFHLARSLVEWLGHKARSMPNRASESSLRTRLIRAGEQAAAFSEQFGLKLLYQLCLPLYFQVISSFRLDRDRLWYRIDNTTNDQGRYLNRIEVGRTPAERIRLRINGEFRTAFPCERLTIWDGLERVTWNPARLGVGDRDVDLPVYLSVHAIQNFHDRLPMLPVLPLMHRVLAESFRMPVCSPGRTAESVLVAVGPPGKKYGYMVADVHDEFVLAKTFLFLTMQGTPEAARLRERLGLTRSAIEYYKLDQYSTFRFSDIGKDPDLVRALSDCGCAHLIAMRDTSNPLAWLERYREPFLKDVGLLPGHRSRHPSDRDGSGRNEPPGEDPITAFTQRARRALKVADGWLV